jgi:hypothetical protein
MLALLIALAGALLCAYGWVADDPTLLLSGFLAVLFGLGLNELPVWRRVRDAHVDPSRPHDEEAGDLVDLSEVDWSALHRRSTPSQAADLPRIRSAA